jgi:transposase
MRRFVEGTDRSPATLFPERLEDWICEDNPVRAVDVFVDELDLAELGFGGLDPEATGRPSYHPSVLLKLYIYGYLNRVQSAARYGVPAIYFNRFFAEAGGLINYSSDYAEQFRQAPAYIDRILKGAKPADLPVQQPTKYELIINLKTVKALGLEIPAKLLALADEVIE